MSKKRVALIDGSSYLHRAFHALPPLTNSQKEPTGAMFGVLNMIKKLLDEYQPELVAVIFDAKGKNFRHEIYQGYKATRPPMHDELKVQIEPLKKMIEALGLPLIALEGVEADDVIATLAKKAKQKHYQVLISTGDKDIAQIVDSDITLINTMTNSRLDPKGVEEKFGVKPSQIVDYLALIGDSVDNIPGVPKVGAKTAVKWLQEYHSLENIIQHAHEIPGKVGENLRHTLKLLPISRQLITLKDDVDLGFNLEDLVRKSEDKAVLKELFTRYEFRSWLNELLSNEKPEEKKATHYETVCDEKSLNRWLEKLKKSDYFAFDTETNNLDALAADLVGLSFSLRENAGIYVPLAHQTQDKAKQLDRENVLDAIKPLLTSGSHTIIGQNLKYDINVLSRYDIEVTAPCYDTMLESYVLDSSQNRHDLDSMALKYLGHKNTSFEEIAGKGKNQLTFDQLDIATATHYAAEDADIALRLHNKLFEKIKSDKDLRFIFETIEMPVMKVLAKMEQNGVKIDANLLREQSLELSQKIEALQEEAYKKAGKVFNANSPKQLQEILYTDLKIPVIAKTPTGVPSTAEDVLQELALEYELPKIILEFRSFSKLKSTYTDALPQQINPRTGRVHTSYNQAVTSTGRLSSTNPNLQNIPVRTSEGRRIRKAFIAEKGHEIVAADYSQIELRIMAHLSQDKGLCKAFERHLDIHRATAAEVFNCHLDEVTELQRRQAKAINFGLIYGMSPYGLAKQIGVDAGIAKKYIDRYFQRYPGVQDYMIGIRQIAREQGYVETLYGRRLYIPEIKSTQFQRRNAAERAAINAPMQGTAADIIKIAMITLQEAIHESKLQIKMIMQVHDELVFEVVESDVAKAEKLIEKHMTRAAKLIVPIVVSIRHGKNWEEAH